MWNLFLLLAEDPPPADPGQGGGNPFGALLPFLFIIPLFWLLLIRPARKQEAQRKALLANLEKDDKILTNGGIIGYVVSVQDDEVTVRIADNVKVKMVKSGIAQNLTKLEALAAPKATETAITTK
ncbi:MAG TPA: preprotein translocase subunit YajC [Gemmataceae bacterium]|nr:preprotein translocase subunit YajC [Gemmataceae bacterium]